MKRFGRAVLAAALILGLVGQASAQTQTTSTVTLTTTQLTACNTTPITLLGPTPGTAYFLVRAYGVRTGAAYATQPGEIQFRYVTSAPFAHMRLDTAAGGILFARR